MNKVMFFAHLRDSVGEEIVNMEAAGKTIAQLKTEIAEKYGLKMETVMAAINEEFAGNEELIQDGDVVAFIPPVSGG